MEGVSKKVGIQLLITQILHWMYLHFSSICYEKVSIGIPKCYFKRKGKVLGISDSKVDENVVICYYCENSMEKNVF